MRKKILTIATMLLVASGVAADEATDIAALKELDQAYAIEWKEGDADGVMALFTHDATLVPHHGDPVIKGHEEIRDFWFNPEYPPTVVPEWTRTAHEVVVLGDTGVVRGRARLVWEYEGTRTTIPDGNYVMVTVREGEGWKIRLLTWNDDPRSWVQESVSQ